MLIGITALILFLSVIVFHQLPHGKMWSSAVNFLGLTSVIGAQTTPALDDDKEEDLDDGASDRSLTPTPETTKSHLTQVEAPSVTVDIPTFSFGGQSNEEEDDDEAPAFPGLNSAQRASGGISSLRQPPTLSALPTSRTMPPPPVPNRNSTTSIDNNLRMPPPPIPSRNLNAAANARLPSPVPPPSSGLGVPRSAASSLALPPSATTKLQKPRKKVILEPGHSPLDWARLQQSGVDLRDLPHSNLLKVTPSLLTQHKTLDSCWIAIEDKVYNATAYLPFHPGGAKEVMRIAGRDGTKLYMKTHPWVNYENMLRGCLVGMLVKEGDESKEGAMEEMD